MTQLMGVILLLLLFIKLVFTVSNEQFLVDAYVKYINNRKQEALQYEFPTDARMYEPENKILEGNHSEKHIF